jgi:hypothetical protein
MAKISRSSAVNVIGADEIKRNLKIAGVKLGLSVRQGLIRAGLFLQRKSQEIVPIDTSTLKNSAGTRADGYNWDTVVSVFYTATYAVYVHERTKLKHKEGKSAKYLEKPARQHKAKILRLIAGEIDKSMDGVKLSPSGKVSGGGKRRWANQYGSGFVGG